LDVLAEADGLAAAAPDVLHALGSALGLPFGALWVPDASGSRLRCLGAWSRPGFPDRRLAEDLRAMVLEPGDGVAGQAFATRKPLAVPSLEALTPCASGLRVRTAGLRGGLGFPIQHADALYGAVELYDVDVAGVEEGLLEAAANLGKQLGQFATRRRALRELAHREAELADLFDHAPVPMHASDAHGRIVRANAAELALLGYEAEAYVGRRVADLHVDPALAARMLERLRAGESVVKEDALLRHRDGRVLCVRLQWTAARRDGAILQVRSFGRDVTAERADQVRLGEIERRFLGFVEGVRDSAIVTLDPEGRITSWNPGAERLLGWTAGEALHQPFERSYPEEDRLEGVPARLLRAALEEGEVRHDGWRLRGGSRFWAETVLTTVRSADGQPIEVLVVLRDLTERRRLEELRLRTGDLEAANRAVVVESERQEEMLHGVERSVAQSCATVRAAALALQAAVEQGRAPAPSDTRGLLAGVEALERTLAEGTQVARAAVRHIDMHPVPLDPLRVAMETCELLRPSATARLVRLEVDVTPELTEMVADPRRLRQVLGNLVQHAIASSRDRGRVAVRLLTEGPHDVRIEVEDTGLGLKPEEIPHAFDPPGAGADASARPAGGLGLAAVKRIVEAQGGRVSVQSTLGRGSVHVAVVPRQPRRALAREAALPEVHQRVLVVGGEASLRASLSWSLGTAGHEVHAVETPEEALTLAHEQPFDAVALELARSGFDPLAFLHDLRREGASRGLAHVLAWVAVEGGAHAVLAVHDLLPRACAVDRLVAALERTHVPRDRSLPLLVVDGDLAALRQVEQRLVQLGYAVTAEADGDAALRAAASQRHGALLLGLFPLGMDAFELLAHLRRPVAAPAPPVLLLVPAEVVGAPPSRRLLAAADAAHERAAQDGGARGALAALAAARHASTDVAGSRADVQ
jgi:PAS domain S-box-containing protein